MRDIFNTAASMVWTSLSPLPPPPLPLPPAAPCGPVEWVATRVPTVRQTCKHAVSEATYGFNNRCLHGMICVVCLAAPLQPTPPHPTPLRKPTSFLPSSSPPTSSASIIWAAFVLMRVKMRSRGRTSICRARRGKERGCSSGLHKLGIPGHCIGW